MNEEGLPEQSQYFLMLKDLQRCLLMYSQQDDNIKRQLFSLFNQNAAMFHQIHYLLMFVRQVKDSIKIQKQKLSMSKSNQSAQIGPIPELVIKQVKNIKRINQENIVCVANKLKVFVSKTMQIQSSKLRYIYNSYTSMLADQLICFRFLNSVEKMREQFDRIRRTFNTVSVNAARLHRHHPSDRVLPQIGANFYVSFYMENLLFFQDQPLPFNGNILFAPIFLMKIKNKEAGKYNFAHIDPRYISELYRENQNWETFCLQLIFRDKVTCQIKHYFCASYQKKGSESSDICSQLRKIRTFVYFSLLFNYLKNTLQQNDITNDYKRSLIIRLKDNLILEINTEKQIYDEKIKSNAKIFQEFLRYFQQEDMRKRAETNRMQVLNNLVSYLQVILCKSKYETYVSPQYINLKPKYIYVGNQRIQV